MAVDRNPETEQVRPPSWVRVAAAVPAVNVADCPHNADRVLAPLAQVGRDGAEVVVLAELCLTGYTYADLFAQRALLDAARVALRHVAAEGARPLRTRPGHSDSTRFPV
jgi:predicted amidohydrolase